MMCMSDSAAPSEGRFGRSQWRGMNCTVRKKRNEDRLENTRVQKP